MNCKRTYSNEQFIEAVKNSVSIAELLRNLGFINVGGHYTGVKSLIKKLDLDTSHFIGQAHMKGKTHSRFKIPLQEILVENSNYSSTNGLKKRLFKANLLERKCSCCNLTEWLGKPISLELDHINGIRNDNRIENLRILCPNCHSQTETYCGKNVGKYARRDLNSHPIKERILSPSRISSSATSTLRNTCKICDKVIGPKSVHCRGCAVKITPQPKKIDWPSDEALRNMIAATSRLAVSKQLGVSDNAIKKHLQRSLERTELSNSV